MKRSLLFLASFLLLLSLIAAGGLPPALPSLFH